MKKYLDYLIIVINQINPKIFFFSLIGLLFLVICINIIPAVRNRIKNIYKTTSIIFAIIFLFLLLVSSFHTSFPQEALLFLYTMCVLILLLTWWLKHNLIVFPAKKIEVTFIILTIFLVIPGIIYFHNGTVLKPIEIIGIIFGLVSWLGLLLSCIILISLKSELNELELLEKCAYLINATQKQLDFHVLSPNIGLQPSMLRGNITNYHLFVDSLKTKISLLSKEDDAEINITYLSPDDLDFFYQSRAKSLPQYKKWPATDKTYKERYIDESDDVTINLFGSNETIIEQTDALKKFMTKYNKKFEYDEKSNSLIFKGIMTTTEKTIYLNESLGDTEKNAIERLFQVSRSSSSIKLRYWKKGCMEIKEDKKSNLDNREMFPPLSIIISDNNKAIVFYNYGYLGKTRTSLRGTIYYDIEEVKCFSLLTKYYITHLAEDI